MRENKIDIILLSLIIAFIITIGIRWFSNGIIIYADTHIPIDKEAYSQRMLSVWDYVTGYGDARHLLLWFYVYLILIFDFIAKLFSSSIQQNIQIVEFIIFLLNTTILVYGSKKLFDFILLSYVKKYANIRLIFKMFEALIILFLIFIVTPIILLSNLIVQLYF